MTNENNVINDPENKENIQFHIEETDINSDCTNEIQKLEWKGRHKDIVSIFEEGSKKLIKIIDMVVTARHHNNDKEEISDVLYEMTMYAHNHFNTEKKYLRQFEYAESQLHDKEHKDFGRKTVNYCNMTMKGNYDITDDLLEYLRQWLTNHILGSDKKFTDTITDTI